MPLKTRATALRRRKAAHRNILVPVDGSPPSHRAAREAAALARKLGAGLIGLHVLTPFEALPRKGLPDVGSVPDFERHAKKVAERCVSAVRKAAAAQGIPCRCRIVKYLSASNGVLATAKLERCGYIVMASHRRRGLPRMLLGSVTREVLAKSPIPVLVCP